MNSCLYQATVMHHRLKPKQHRFHYRLYQFYLDLDELDWLPKKLIFFSRNRFNLFSFKDKEHLQLPLDRPNTQLPVKEQILLYLKEQGIELVDGKIFLLTNLSILGYNFNPVSFYYCFDATGAPVCCVAEVGNTYKEMKPYLLNTATLQQNVFHQRVTKYFYVSPFINHDASFDFKLEIPAERLNIKIDDYDAAGRFFISTLTGKKRALTNRRMIWLALRFPLMTLRIIGLIHWQAVRLWLKKIPYHPKAANPQLQQNVYKKYQTKP